MLEALLFSLQITMPNVFLMVLGWLLRKKGMISDGFIDGASRIVFNVSMPCLLFFGLIRQKIDFTPQFQLVMAGVCVTLILFIVATLYAKRYIAQIEDRGVFVQGVFRSNAAVVGLAMVINAYGATAVGTGAVLAGALTFLYNILAVIALTIPDPGVKLSWGQRLLPLLKKMATNPLIVAIMFAIICQPIAVYIPETLFVTGKLLADLALPMALLCAGATFNAATMFNLSGVSLQASIGRVLIAPLLTIAVGIEFGLTGMMMGVLFLLSAAPVAAVSYVMARSMGGNETAAANILGFTTFASIFSTAIGAAILRHFGLI